MARARTLARLVVLVSVAAMGVAPAARALSPPQRFASPTGSGTACTSTNPCDIVEAINNANNGDEVIVTPGDYGSAASPITTPISTFNGIDLHGESGHPRPRIFVSSNQPFTLYGASESIRHLHLELTGTYGLLMGSGTAEDVFVKSTGSSSSTGCYLAGSIVVRNSVCYAPGGIGLQAYPQGGAATPTLRNVTAVGNTGMVALGAASYPLTVNAFNTIFEGLVDIAVSTPSGGTVTVNPDHSFHHNDQTSGSGAMTINTGAGDITGSQYPAFADFSNGDFHQVFGSNTIDAGADDVANGPQDFDGQNRQNGTHTDIGADEFYPLAAVAKTQDASGVTKTAATLKGTVNPEYDQASYHFEYGKTTAYGSSTPTNGLLAVGNDVPVTADLTGLAPGTTYHYRLVASNTTGADQGDDLTFRTVPQAANGVFEGLVLPAAQTVKVKKGVANVGGRCDADAQPKCTGSLSVKSAKAIKLRVAKKKGKKPKIITVGTATFTGLPDDSVTIAVTLSKAAKKFLKKHKKLKAVATAITHDDAGHSKTTTGKVTLKGKKKKKKKKHKGHAALAAWSY